MGLYGQKGSTYKKKGILGTTFEKAKGIVSNSTKVISKTTRNASDFAKEKLRDYNEMKEISRKKQLKKWKRQTEENNTKSAFLQSKAKVKRNYEKSKLKLKSVKKKSDNLFDFGSKSNAGFDDLLGFGSKKKKKRKKKSNDWGLF